MNRIFPFNRSHLFFSVIGLLLALVMMTVIPVLAAVTLVSFTATPGNGQVLVAWQTATETDNAGFFIYRSIHQSSGFVAISPLISPSGSGSTGGQYSYLDTNVSNGITYFYELVAVNGSNETEYFAPVGPIVPGVAVTTATQTLVVTRTPTATGPTNTRTATPTLTLPPSHISTATQIGAYPGPLPSLTPGSFQTPNPTQYLTPYPGPATTASVNVQGTPGADSTAGNQLLQEGGPTSTLLPFPNITLEFPDSTQTPDISIKSTSQPGDNGLSGWVNMARLGPLALILLIWILLGGWFYLTLRRMD